MLPVFFDCQQQRCFKPEPIEAVEDSDGAAGTKLTAQLLFLLLKSECHDMTLYITIVHENLDQMCFKSATQLSSVAFKISDKL